jgi:hypothetical protein
VIAKKRRQGLSQELIRPPLGKPSDTVDDVPDSAGVDTDDFGLVLQPAEDDNKSSCSGRSSFSELVLTPATGKEVNPLSHCDTYGGEGYFGVAVCVTGATSDAEFMEKATKNPNNPDGLVKVSTSSEEASDALRQFLRFKFPQEVGFDVLLQILHAICTQMCPSAKNTFAVASVPSLKTEYRTEFKRYRKVCMAKPPPKANPEDSSVPKPKNTGRK